MIESGPEGARELDDCVVSSATENMTLLTAIRASLDRGVIIGSSLRLGQTVTVKQVAKKIKFHFELGEQARCNDTSPPDLQAVGQFNSSWSEEVEDEGAHGEAVSDGSCEHWINRYIRQDFNKLARQEEDFYLKDWMLSKNLSSGGQKKFFSRVPRSVMIKTWARKITELLRAEGVEIGSDEVDTAGLWAIRKYNGQVNVIGNGDQRRIVRKN
eukprot:334682_1